MKILGTSKDPQNFNGDLITVVESKKSPTTQTQAECYIPLDYYIWLVTGNIPILLGIPWK